MSEKQAKRQRQEARQLSFEYTIRAYNDGYIEVHGPLDNFLLYREIMARAELAVIKRLVQGEQSRIVVPKPDLRNLKLQ